MEIKKFSIEGQEVVTGNDLNELDETGRNLVKMSNKAKAVSVVDQESYEYAANSLQMVESVTKAIEDITERFRKPAYDYYKGVLSAKNALLAPGQEASKHLRKEMSAYLAEQDRIRKEEERKLLEAARQKAEEEALEALQAALDAGDDVGAELALEEASAAPQVDMSHLRELTPKVDGISYRDNWKAGWDGPMEEAMKKLCRAVADGKAPANLLSLNTSEATRIAKALQDNMNIPGLKAVNQKVIIRR